MVMPTLFLDFSGYMDKGNASNTNSLRPIDPCLGAAYRELANLLRGTASYENPSVRNIIHRILCSKLALWSVASKYVQADVVSSPAAAFQYVQYSHWGQERSATLFTHLSVLDFSVVECLMADLLGQFSAGSAPIVIAIDEAVVAKEHWFHEQFTSNDATFRISAQPRGFLGALLFELARHNVAVALAGTAVGLKAAALVGSPVGKASVAVQIVSTFCPLSVDETRKLLGKYINAGGVQAECAALLAGKGRYVEHFVRELMEKPRNFTTAASLTDLATKIYKHHVELIKSKLVEKIMRPPGPDSFGGDNVTLCIKF